MKFPNPGDLETYAGPTETEVNELDVYLREGQLVDVILNGESVFPTWFKIEFKESGEVSAKVKGVRISSKRGDLIRIHQT
jgi:hypothetical protein